MFYFSLIDFSLSPIQIAGNILTLLGLILFAISSFCSKKRDILLFQTGNHSLSVIGESLLGQTSGAVQEGVSIIRNIFILCHKNNKVWNIIFIVLGLVLGVVFNVVFQLDNLFMMGIGFLPVFASFQYSIIILLPKMKVPHIKASMAVSSSCWCIYGLFSKNYSMAIFNTIICISSIITIIIYFVRKKKASPVEENNEIQEQD